jgi:uncharacterized protein (DUF362 family)/NAD-dependent dihydropyrimidine dehydrogenase PreA subunit
VQNTVRRLIDSLGGIANFVKPQSKVLVKPNLLMAKEPESGIDTHPEVLRAVIRILKEINCAIFVGDGPSVWGDQIENVDEVYSRTGTEKVCREEGVSLVKFDKRRWRGDFPLTTWLDDCDHLINICKFKTHEFTVLTGAVKNLFGLVSGTYKTEMHKKYFKIEDFSRALVDVFAATPPALSVMDGILALEGDGPATGGKARQMDLLLASADCVALDSVMAVIAGLEPLDILTTRYAAERGLGVADLNSISIKGESLKSVACPDFQLPQSSAKKKIPAPVAKLARKLIKYRPRVVHEKCIRCSACVDACPQKIIRLKNGRIVIDYSKCISCFCCSEACPESAIKIKKSLVAKLIGL